MAPKRQKIKTTTKTLRGEDDDTVDVYDFDAQITSATTTTTEKEEEEETARAAARGTKKKKKSNAATTTTTKAKPKAQQTKAKAKAITTTKRRSRLQNQGVVPPGDPRERPKETIALEFVKGPFKGTRFENPNNLPSLKIGRVKPGNQIHVKDDAVSQKHAHIFWNANTNRWEIVDLGSSNGTYVDDVELDEHSEARALKDGSTIKIGNQTTVRARIRPREGEEEVGEEKDGDDDEREGESAKKKKKKTKQTGASKKSVGVVAIEATKTKKSPLSASAKGNKKTDNDNLADVPAKSPLPSVGPKKRVAPPIVSEKKKAKKTETAEENDNNEDEDEENGKSNETTLERLQRWSSELVDDVRASAERAVERLFREKKKIEADLRQEFAV